MKKMSKTPFIVIAVVLVVLMVVLYFITPIAPVLLLLSLLIQVPIILGITHAAMNRSYDERAFERRTQYQKDGDAATWLAAEEKEAAAVGTRFWSGHTKALSALNRAEPLVALGRKDDAAALLAQLEENRLDKPLRTRFAALVADIRAGGEADAMAKDDAESQDAPTGAASSGETAFGEAPPAE